MSGGYIGASVSRTQELRSKCVSKPKVFLKRKTSRGNNETRQLVTKARDGGSERSQNYQGSESYSDKNHEVVLITTPVI